MKKSGASNDPNEQSWVNIDENDISMEAMNDPYSNKFKNITKEFQKVSEYSPIYESWQLKAVIVKANDDVR